MANYTIKKVSEMESTFGGGLKKARAELGVTSFGLAIEEFPPDFSDYPAHDHSNDGQEEVYIVISGSGEIEIDGERHPIDSDTAVRVGPGVDRRIFSGPEGLRLVALGGVPGKAYEVPQFTEPGAPDPLAS